MVRPGSEADARRAARLHTERIDEGFLSTLGVPFLTRLYRRIVRDPASLLLVADEGGEVVGFAAATEHVRRFYRAFLLRDGPVAAPLAAPRLIRSWRSALETLRYPSSSAALPRAGLLSIAVAESAEGSGIGRSLVRAVTSEMERRGVRALRVVTGADNTHALRMYEACGFRRAGHREVHRGTPSEVLVWP